MSCCLHNEYGFKCHCRKRNPLYDDDGYGDWLYDQMRDEQMEREAHNEDSE